MALYHVSETERGPLYKVVKEIDTVPTLLQLGDSSGNRRYTNNHTQRERNYKLR